MTMQDEMELKIAKVEQNPSLLNDKHFVDTLSSYSMLPYDFMLKYKDKLNWFKICINRHMSIEFLEKPELRDYLDYGMISAFQKLTEEYIDKHYDLLDWYQICRIQDLSDEFLFNHIFWIDLDGLAANKKMKFRDSFWRQILIFFPDYMIDGSAYPITFSKDFIREFRNNFKNVTKQTINSKSKKLWKELGVKNWDKNGNLV